MGLLDNAGYCTKEKTHLNLSFNAESGTAVEATPRVVSQKDCVAAGKLQFLHIFKLESDGLKNTKKE